LLKSQGTIDKRLIIIITIVVVAIVARIFDLLVIGNPRVCSQAKRRTEQDSVAAVIKKGGQDWYSE
jgi:hypothetical protein